MPELRDAEVTTDDAHGLGAKIPSTVDAPPTSADSQSTSPSQTTGSVSNPSNMVLSPECVRPYPKALPRKNTQNRSKKTKSTVITDTPETDALMEKHLAKKKINKKNKKLKTSKNIKNSCSNLLSRQIPIFHSENQTILMDQHIIYHLPLRHHRLKHLHPRLKANVKSENSKK